MNRWGAEGEGGRKNSKQALCCQHGTQCGSRSHDGEMKSRVGRHWLSHPGAFGYNSHIKCMFSPSNNPFWWLYNNQHGAVQIPYLGNSRKNFIHYTSHPNPVSPSLLSLFSSPRIPWITPFHTRKIYLMFQNKMSHGGGVLQHLWESTSSTLISDVLELSDSNDQTIPSALPLPFVTTASTFSSRGIASTLKTNSGISSSYRIPTLLVCNLTPKLSIL